MKKIMIFGIPGSGKSTFALQISKKLNIPLYHLDRYFFTEGWKERDYEEFLKIQKELVEKEAWIIDGNATKSLEMRYSRADTALYFRFNRFLCLWRIFKRLLFKDHRISDRAEGCCEKVRARLIRYLWGFHQRVEKTIEELRMKYPHVEFQQLSSQQDLERFVKRFSSNCSPLQP